MTDSEFDNEMDHSIVQLATVRGECIPPATLDEILRRIELGTRGKARVKEVIEKYCWQDPYSSQVYSGIFV